IAQCASDRAKGAALLRAGELREPGAPGTEGVGGEILTAAIERQCTPAAAEGGHTAIAVLEIEQPLHAETACDFGLAGNGPEGKQREERTRGVVGIRHAAGEIGPRPAA